MQNNDLEKNTSLINNTNDVKINKETTEKITKNIIGDNINNNGANETTEGKRKKAIFRISIFLLIVLIIGVIYGINWYTNGRWHQDTENAYINSSQNVVTAQVTGRIVQLNIEDTQEVKEGDLLAVIDDTDYKINFEKAEADLAKAVKLYYSLSSNVNQFDDILLSKQTELKKAQSDFSRDSAAYKQGLISKEAYDVTVYSLEQAKVAVSQARKQQDNARVQAISSSIYTHPEVKAAIVNYTEAYVNLERTKIYAPISGIIAKKSVYIGQKVASNQELMTIINLNDIWVDANLKENQLKNVKIGNTVEMESDVNGKKYKGYITGISAGTGNAFSILPAQNATGNWIKIVQRIPVRIAIDKDSLNDNGVVPVGSSMIININTRTENDQPNINKSVEQKTNLYNIDESEINQKISIIIDANLGRR